MSEGGAEIAGCDEGGRALSMRLRCAEGGVHMVQSIVMNPNLLELLARAELSAFDANRDGVLDFAEFSGLARKMSAEYGFPPFGEVDLVLAFRMHDWDGSGGLSQDEFSQCFRWMLLRVCPLRLKKRVLIQRMDSGLKVWGVYDKGKRLGSGYFGECFRIASYYCYSYYE